MAFTANELVVVDLFIAAYGRAPTQEGLDYWTNELETGSKTSSEIAELMINNDEGHERFPEGLTTAEKVAQVFQNVLGRAPATQEGKDFWAAKFDDASYTMADLVDEVLKVARDGSPGDEETLENKRDVVEHFLDVIPEDKQAGFQVNTDPVVTDADVIVAKEGVDALLNAGVPLELTTKVDAISKDGHITDKGTDDEAEVEASDKLNVKLSSSNDTIKADVGTLQTGDSIVDGSTDDHDTLEAKMEASLGTTAATDSLDPTDGPTITNIEDITLRDNQQVSVYNVANISGTENLNIDSKGNTFFNSGDDVASLEIREADGEKIKNVVAIDNTTALYLTEVSNGLNVILKDDVTNLDMDAKDGSPDHKVSVELKGAQITLGLADDNDDLDSTTNDGGSFGEMTLIGADKASTVTLAADTSLHNVTDQVAPTNAADTADIADGADTTVTFGAIQAGVNVVGTEPETSTASNAGLADKLILDGDQDITLVGTVAQFDEAVIEEKDEATSDDMNSVITLTTDVDLAATDLTAAAVDRVVVSALHGDVATVNEVSEIAVDVDTIVEVKAIEDNDSLVVTGENATDALDIEINVGNASAARGNLVLGGDAHISTADLTSDTSSASGAESGSSGAAAAQNLDANAATAKITVTSNSNLNVLDVSQLTNKTFTLEGDDDLTVGILVMGGDDTDQSASILDGTKYTGDLQADFVIDADTGYNDGEDVNGDLGGANRVLLGSGNDVLGNVGIVTDANEGDDIAMGAGDDVVKIGSIDTVTSEQANDAVSAEIWGQEGRDTFVFQSRGDTVNVTDATHNNSTIEIEDFDAGSNGDQLSFDTYYTYAIATDVVASLDSYDNDRIVSDTNADAATMAANSAVLNDGNVVLVSTDDIDDFDAASVVSMFELTTAAGTATSVFTEQEAGGSTFHDEYIFIVGETSGNDGVKIYYVHDGDANDDITATLIGQLQNLNEDINITTLTNDNFDFI